jgi:hypothetical protein
MLRHKTCGFLGLILALLSACLPDANITVTPTVRLIDREEFVRESTSIAQASRFQATDVSGTAIAAATYVAQRESINAQLALTLRAAVPPTEQIVDSSGPVTPGRVATLSPLDAPTSIPNAGEVGASIGATVGETQFTEIATTSVVREDDGCADGTQNSFSLSTSRIYATARAYNIRAGTEMGADWLLNGQVVHQSLPWSVESDDDDFCLWFYIEPTDVPFTAGNWMVRLYANGQALNPPASFTIG